MSKCHIGVWSIQMIFMYFMMRTILSMQLTSFQDRGEDTIGYTKFEGICQSETVDKRPFVSTIVCANRCDRNPKCAGFQVSNHSYSLMIARCQPARLLTVGQKSSEQTKHFSQVGQQQAYPLPPFYYMREVPCKLSADCPLKCLVPNPNFSCDCIDGYCYPYIKSDAPVGGYQHYVGSCEDSVRGRNYPIESVSHCKAKCNGDPKCTGFSLAKRYCQTLTKVCSPHSFQQQNSSQRLGRHYYVKNFFHNFTCHSDTDCRKSSHSVCAVVFGVDSIGQIPPDYNDRCRCGSNECEVADGAQALPSLRFTELLNAKEPFRVTSSNDAQSISDCFDKHICCSTLFTNPDSNCTDADAITCPKSCGVCKSVADCGKPETITEDPDCASNAPLCSHPTLSPLMVAQCPKTCKTCGKSAKNLGISCPACRDEQPDCEQLSNDDKCKQVQSRCRKSCECIG